ncbi:MAG: DUF4080 domain-containing protein [Clostridia bacterium]|nr:DUF4080 domain-containing protein [Clostridia bacterium]
MKVLLSTLNTKYVHTNIAIKYLYESAKDKNIEVIEFTINEPINKILREIYDRDANVIAFSVYLWNIDEILKLSENIKKIQPKIKIVLGGPEVTYQSRLLLEKYTFIDYILIGEGEESFPKLLDFMENENQEKDILKNVSYRKDDGTIVEGEIAIVCDTNKIPKIASQIVEGYDGKIVYIETVRGCPYNCSYCLSSTIKGIRPFDMQRVKDELLILMKAKIRLVKFVDRTFNYDKQRALEIWKFILENNISSEFHFEISAHLIDEEVLEFLESVPAGVFRLEIGVQSTNPETIKAINRTTNFEIIKSVVQRIMNKGNITTHLDLIAGLPFEGYERFKESFNDVYDLKPTELQLGFLKLLSGCEITMKKDKYSYEYTSYPPYEILQNEFISFEELSKLKYVEEMVDVYHNSLRYKNSFGYVLNKYEKPFDMFYELSRFALENNYFTRKISAEEWFDVLARFYIYKNFEDYNEFKEALKKDHFENFGNKRRRGLIFFE